MPLSSAAIGSRAPSIRTFDLAYKPLDDYRARVEEVAKTLASTPEALAIFRKVADRVDPDRVVALQQKYAAELVDFDPIGLFKYADLPFWLADKVNVVRQLGLDRCEPRAILDIGMGAGHFAAVCQALGHTVVGTDIQVPLYDDICEKGPGGGPPDRADADADAIAGSGPEVHDMVTVISGRCSIYFATCPTAIANTGRPTTGPVFYRRIWSIITCALPGSSFSISTPISARRARRSTPALLAWCKDHGANVDAPGGRVCSSTPSTAGNR